MPGHSRASESDANDVTTETSQCVALPSTPSTKRRRKVLLTVTTAANASLFTEVEQMMNSTLFG